MISEKNAKYVVGSFSQHPGLFIEIWQKKVGMTDGYVQKVRKEKGLRSYKIPLTPSKIKNKIQKLKLVRESFTTILFKILAA